MNLSPLFWTPGLLVGIVIVIIALSALAKARLRKRYPPIGQMVDIGGARLHIHVEGEGSPTVVLEAGAGGIGLSWELVRPAIARVTRVVVYDRAGLGWSDPSPRPRRADVMAEELHTLLHKASIDGPYILAGHSLGGPVARHFASKYPGEVVGLVMVDSAHEQQSKHFPERLVKMVERMQGMVAVMRLVGRSGILALNPKAAPVGDLSKLPTGIAEMIRGVVASKPGHVETTIAETMSVAAAETQPVTSFGDLPLTVISHGHLDANAVPPSLGPDIRDEYERAWQKLQAEITSLSRRGRRIVAEESGHNIIFEQPEIVIDSILEMLSSGTIRKEPEENMAAAPS